MKKDKFLHIKKEYETALIEKISSLVGIDKKHMIAQWGLESTTLNISLEDSVDISKFNMTYKDNNLFLDMEFYKVLTGEKNGTSYVNGIQSRPSTIDANTLNVLKQAFEEVLEADVDVDAVDAPLVEAELINDTYDAHRNDTDAHGNDTDDTDDTDDTETYEIDAGEEV